MKARLNTLGPTFCALVLATFPTAGCADPAGLEGGNDYPLVVEPAGLDLAPPERAAYEEDAVRLAIRRLHATGSPDTSAVNPPLALVASLYNALLHVHGSSHAARDSVVDVHGIHTFPNPGTGEIMVRVDPARSWTQAWKSLNAETGNEAVDALMAEHELSVREYYEWSIGDVAVLRAARPLNAAALAARFEPIPGVIWAERNGAIGDGNDIRAQPHGDGWRLDYSIGFGDCPAGCIGRYGWSFGVTAAGEVAFLGTSGNPPSSSPGP